MDIVVEWISILRLAKEWKPPRKAEKAAFDGGQPLGCSLNTAISEMLQI